MQIYNPTKSTKIEDDPLKKTEEGMKNSITNPERASRKNHPRREKVS